MDKYLDSALTPAVRAADLLGSAKEAAAFQRKVRRLYSGCHEFSFRNRQGTPVLCGCVLLIILTLENV